MGTTTMPPMGRERRRKGPVNRVRRFLYGVLLLAAAPGATATDELASVGKFRDQIAPPAPERAALATVQGLLVLRARADGGPHVSLDSATAQVPQQDSGLAPQFRVSAERTPEDHGTAFDLPVTDLGDFRLTLRSERSILLSAWSLGGTLEVRLAHGRGSKVVPVPTLRINDMYGQETRYLAFDAAVTQHPSGEPQIAFRWRI
jgi:hypothetical protein